MSGKWWPGRDDEAKAKEEKENEKEKEVWEDQLVGPFSQKPSVASTLKSTW